MRIHLGHHFYGAGNLGDDFMVAGFLVAMRTVAPEARFTACVPFPLEPLRRRFPEIAWQPYEEPTRAAAIERCDAWLGLGGSPFQSAQSRWFIDHLIGDAALCRRHGKPMFYLGVGVQTATELSAPGIADLCAQAAGIWTRDAASAERLAGIGVGGPVIAAADLAHVYFRGAPPPPAVAGRLGVVPNFDYAEWPGMGAFCRAADRLAPRERMWLAQESRELPGAEKALFSRLPDPEKARWTLRCPDVPGAPLDVVMHEWPSAEWLVTARFHAALAGAWAGSKIIVLATNEKLRGVAHELAAATLAPDADEPTIVRALQEARIAPRPLPQAALAYDACAGFVKAAGAH